MDIEGYVRFLEGMSGFIFFNRFFEVHVPEGINRQITRIIERYNFEEEVVAKKAKRDPILLPPYGLNNLSGASTLEWVFFLCLQYSTFTAKFHELLRNGNIL